MNNYEICLSFGGIIFPIGCSGSLLTALWGVNLLIDVLVVFLVSFGYILIFYGMVGLVRKNNIDVYETFYNYLSNEFTHQFVGEMNKDEGNSANIDFWVIYMRLWSKKKIRTHTKEGKHLYKDLNQFNGLINEAIKNKTASEIFPFQSALIDALERKIKSPILNYQGVEIR